MARANLPGLTKVRFFAALWVISFHQSNVWEGSKSAFADLCSIGYVGVTVFFVLSGFILGYNYLDTLYSNQKFWVARAARILPVYWLALAVDLPTAILSASKRGIHFFPGCFAAPLLLQSWIPSSSLLWNPPGWSLSTEAFFYLAFPFLAPQLAALFRKYPLPTLAVLWLAGSAPTIAYAFLHPEGAINQWSMTFWISVVKFNPLARLPEFGLGVCLGTAYLDGWRVPRPRIWLTVCCLATIGLAMILHPIPYPTVR